MTEFNFDGIPGPTHNYAGLARGNLAAEKNAQQPANPLPPWSSYYARPFPPWPLASTSCGS